METASDRPPSRLPDPGPAISSRDSSASPDRRPGPAKTPPTARLPVPRFERPDPRARSPHRASASVGTPAASPAKPKSPRAPLAPPGNGAATPKKPSGRYPDPRESCPVHARKVGAPPLPADTRPPAASSASIARVAPADPPQPRLSLPLASVRRSPRGPDTPGNR